MKLLVVNVSKGKHISADALVKEYLKRVERHFPVEEQQLKPVQKKSSVQKAREEESEQILRLVKPGDRICVLDERGEKLDSFQFADFLTEASQDPAIQRLIFAIGGSHGHDPALIQKAFRSIALSPMVFNHQVARIVLAEQIYRATTIIRKEPYHH